MRPAVTRRHYPIPNLGFRDFWDICSRFQTLHPEYQEVYYTVDGFETLILLDEPEVAKVLKKLETNKQKVRKYSARFYSRQNESIREVRGMSELHYRPIAYENYQQGLSFFSDAVSKLAHYAFEEELQATYPSNEEAALNVEFGRPCEILAMVIDLRGFSAFCEKPEIESPYTCGLMSAFYDMAEQSLIRFPPEMTKFLGDGVLAIWETSPTDREVAVKVALQAALDMHHRWKMVKDNPYFTHGAPMEIGAGLCFGLASYLQIDDYIGRPINIASRLCSACPGDRVYVDRAVPDIPVNLKKEAYVAHIKPYGRHHVWSFHLRRNESAL